MNDIDNHMNAHGDEDEFEEWPEYDPEGDELRQRELDDFHNRPKPWDKGIGTLAVDLAMMSKGGMLKRQAE